MRRILFTTAVLALAPVATAGPSITITSGFVTITVDCSDLEITGDQTCEGLCDDMDEAEGTTCTYDDGKLIIRKPGGLFTPVLADPFEASALAVEPATGEVVLSGQGLLRVVAFDGEGRPLGEHIGPDVVLPTDAGVHAYVYGLDEATPFTAAAFPLE